MKEYDIEGLVGLSLTRHDKKHIKHDITNKFPIEDGIVDVFQAEDVFEHIEYEKLAEVMDEIYRVLKSGGYFRLSVPDYRFDVYRNRSLFNSNGELAFDPDGGGSFKNGHVCDGGHVWFPVYESVLELVKNSKFTNYEFLHYTDSDGNSVTKEIDYSKGYIQRTPDNDPRGTNPYRVISIVADMYKE